MAFESFNSGDADAAAERMAEFFGPGQIDQSIRQAIHFCWMALPKERKTVDELDSQIRRITERALKDFRDDENAFRRSIKNPP